MVSVMGEIASSHKAAHRNDVKMWGYSQGWRWLAILMGSAIMALISPILFSYHVKMLGLASSSSNFNDGLKDGSGDLGVIPRADIGVISLGDMGVIHGRNLPVVGTLRAFAVGEQQASMR